MNTQKLIGQLASVTVTTDETGNRVSYMTQDKDDAFLTKVVIDARGCKGFQTFILRGHGAWDLISVAETDESFYAPIETLLKWANS